MRNSLRMLAIVVLAISLTCPAFAVKVGDFDGDSSVGLNDIVYMLGWYQTGKSTDATAVVNRAKEILSSASGPLTRLPDNTSDDLSESGVGLDDIVLMLAWYQTGKSTDSSAVESRAKEILSSVNYLSKFPEMDIGSSTVPITITGIQTN